MGRPTECFIFCAFCVWSILALAAATDDAQIDFKICQVNSTLNPTNLLEVMVGETTTLTVQCQLEAFAEQGVEDLVLSYQLDAAEFAQVDIPTLVLWSLEDNQPFEWLIHGRRIGKTTFQANISRSDTGETVWALNSSEPYFVVVSAYESVWNLVAQLGFVLALSLNSVAYGLTLQWEEVEDFIRHPIGAIISFCCQYVIMPAIAYGLGAALRLPCHMALALLCVSCVPGGLPSNAVTMLLGGDTNLSIGMTTIGNVAAFAMTPLWMYTLGQYILQQGYPDAKIHIPWAIASALITLLIVPLLLGIYLAYRFPLVADRICRVIRALALTLCLAMVILMVVIYAWILDYLNDGGWEIVFAGISLPYLAFAISGALAVIVRRSKRFAMTVMIETGIQNLAFAVLLINNSVPKPDNGTAMAIPGLIVLSVYFPMIVVCIIKVLHGFHKVSASKKQIRRESSVTCVGSMSRGGMGGEAVGMENMAAWSGKLGLDDAEGTFRKCDSATMMNIKWPAA